LPPAPLPFPSLPSPPLPRLTLTRLPSAPPPCRASVPSPPLPPAGLPLRKAGFAAIDALLSSAALADRVGAELLPVLASGLRDSEDVKMMVHALLGRMAQGGSTSAMGAAGAAAAARWHALIAEQLPVLSSALASAFEKVRTSEGGGLHGAACLGSVVCQGTAPFDGRCYCCVGGWQSFTRSLPAIHLFAVASRAARVSRCRAVCCLCGASLV